MARATTRKLSNQLRIIGGSWRGRKLNFPDGPALRPTPDRVRETLFNWLRADVPNAKCLDLFAGSGALGFEALSRAAESVTFVEQFPAAVTQLKENAKLLQANANIKQQDVLAFLSAQATQQFDLVFLDPPYGKNLLAPCLSELVKQSWLAEHALIYAEKESASQVLELPDELVIIKEKNVGQVCSLLLRVELG